MWISWEIKLTFLFWSGDHLELLYVSYYAESCVNVWYIHLTVKIANSVMQSYNRTYGRYETKCQYTVMLHITAHLYACSKYNHPFLSFYLDDSNNPDDNTSTESYGRISSELHCQNSKILHIWNMKKTKNS